MKKEIFIKNLSQIAPGIKKKELAEIMDCQPATVSKYLNPERKDFPTVEMLYNLSKHFNVSVDWLLGLNAPSSSNQKMTVLQACQSIVNMTHAFCLDHFSTERHEICYYNDEYSPDVQRKEKNNKYIALYFGAWDQSNDNESLDIFSQIGNYSHSNGCINDFLEKFIRIEEMKKNGSLPTDMYDALLKSYLDEVASF